MYVVKTNYPRRGGAVLAGDGQPREDVLTPFLRQIEKGGPALLTDPETTRFQMAVEEAAALVIEAASRGAGGLEISLLNMGEPLKTAYLAEKMIRPKGGGAGSRHQGGVHGAAGGRDEKRGAGGPSREAAAHAPLKHRLARGKRPAVRGDELVSVIEQLAVTPPEAAGGAGGAAAGAGAAGPAGRRVRAAGRSSG